MSLIGFTKVCSVANSGGIAAIYGAKAADVTSFTLTVNDYSAVTMDGANLFKKYEFEQDMAELRLNGANEGNAFIQTQEVEMQLNRMSTTLRASIEELVKESLCGMIFIVKDNNGVMWVVGYSQRHGKDRGLELVTDTGITGKALTDINSNVVVLSTTSAEMARVFTGTVPLT
jgi:hypothetical protein